MFRMFAVLAWVLFGSAAAQATDLLGSIQNGSVEVISINGNGSSSGTALTGVLRNNTGTELEIDTTLPNPVYFDNGSNGQNMVATQVYLGDMGYYTEGGRSFITLTAGQNVPVVFVAYCADFDLANPEASHSFSVSPLPAGLEGIARKISEFEARAAGGDLTKAAQVALWMARGVSPGDIREKFDFTDQDLALAYEMLN